MAGLMVLYWQPLRELFLLSRHSELHSHAPLIPVVSLYFLFVERRRIFARAGYALAVGPPVAIAGIALYAANGLFAGFPSGGDRLPAAMLGFWLSVVGGSVVFFGEQASRAAAFPLAFLAFMIPLPASWVERIVALLCGGSGAFTERFFQVLGVTFLREESVFHLGRVTIEIAPECSGIRSSLALFITATLAARLMLRSWWGRGLLLLAVVPLAMVKNAIRIATLTLLADYVDMGFLTGDLHRRGGFVFFGITLVLFGGILLVLRRLESGKTVATSRSASPEA
jgi:exosortase